MPTEKQRRQAAQRKIARQLERRREAQRKRRNRNLAAGGAFVGVVAVILILLLATNIFSGSNKKSSAASPSASPSTSVSTSTSPSAGPTASPFPTPTFAKASRSAKTTSGPCKYAESSTELKSPYTKDVGLPPDPSPTPATGTVAVSLKTSHGPMTFTLDRATAPCAVQSFVYLAKKGLYNDSSCPRITTSGIYVLQCGDPSNSQNGGPTYEYKQEATSKSSYGAGVIAMANTGQPKTTGSQFFIIYKDSNKGLQKSYSVIGKVSKGLDVVTKVATGGSDNANGAGDGKPILGLTINSAKLS